MRGIAHNSAVKGIFKEFLFHVKLMQKDMIATQTGEERTELRNFSQFIEVPNEQKIRIPHTCSSYVNLYLSSFAIISSCSPSNSAIFFR